MSLIYTCPAWFVIKVFKTGFWMRIRPLGGIYLEFKYITDPDCRHSSYESYHVLHFGCIQFSFELLKPLPKYQIGAVNKIDGKLVFMQEMKEVN
jgi:hypothetical protein